MTLRTSGSLYNPNNVSITGGNIISSVLNGTTTNDNAAVGKIGEFQTASLPSGTPVSVSNNTTVNVISLSLTAGDWEVSGTVNYTLVGVTGTLFQTGISLTSATLPSQAGGGGLSADPLMVVPMLVTLLSSNYTQNLPPLRLSIPSTTTVYLVGRTNFTLGSMVAFGTINARRVR